MLLPWFLIILGAVFFLENIGIFPAIKWDVYWPLILIAIGLLMLKRKMGDSCCGWSAWKKDKQTSKDAEEKNRE